MFCRGGSFLWTCVELFTKSFTVEKKPDMKVNRPDNGFVKNIIVPTNNPFIVPTKPFCGVWVICMTHDA